VISGKVLDGQSPITGSTIQLYAVGTSGTASAATALITSQVVQTDGNGNFSISGLYSCAGNPMVYIAATGGNPGLANGTNNTGIALMAGLGSCATLQANSASTFITINEVTTVASVYALSGFMSDYTNVGYATANATGMTNAFTTINALASTAAGTAPGITTTGITLPTQRINSLANSIAACVNSLSNTSSSCSTLFTVTGVSGIHLNTIAALAVLAHNPGATTASTIFALGSGSPPFAPTLGSAPSDWTMPIYYTGGGLSGPNGIAFDANGAAWIANQSSNAVTEISSVGFTSGTNGYVSTSLVGPQAVAIDATGNVWLANTGADNVVELNPSSGL